MFASSPSVIRNITGSMVEMPESFLTAVEGTVLAVEAANGIADRVLC